MNPLFARLAARVRTLCAPTGRHRAGPPGPLTPAPPEVRPAARPAATVRPWYGPLDGAATALVRPYLRAHEQQEALRLRRRMVLLAATYGIDLDTRVIHPLEAM